MLLLICVFSLQLAADAPSTHTLWHCKERSTLRTPAAQLTGYDSILQKQLRQMSCFFILIPLFRSSCYLDSHITLSMSYLVNTPDQSNTSTHPSLLTVSGLVKSLSVIGWWFHQLPTPLWWCNQMVGSCLCAISILLTVFSRLCVFFFLCLCFSWPGHGAGGGGSNLNLYWLTNESAHSPQLLMGYTGCVCVLCVFTISLLSSSGEAD